MGVIDNRNIERLKELKPRIQNKLSGQRVVFSAPEMVFLRAMYKEITGRYSNQNCSSCLELYKIINNYLK